MPKNLKRALNIVSTVFMVLVVILAILLVGVRIFGIQPYTVLSGSMEPEYHVGSLIYVVDVDPHDLKVGDPITFMMNETTVGTHRIIEVLYDEEDPTVVRFRTQGDNNDIPDGDAVHMNNVIGKPIFSIPLLGYVANFVQNPPGRYIALLVCAFLLVLVIFPGIGGKKDEQKDESAEQKDSPVKEASVPLHPTRMHRTLRAERATRPNPPDGNAARLPIQDPKSKSFEKGGYITMKNKILKALAVVACAILLVVGSIAGTIAYLTSTDKVVNTFTVGNVSITMDEAAVGADGKALTGENAARVKENSYKLIPGGEYDKDPTIHIASGSEACWLFVKVENGLSSVEDTSNTIEKQISANGWVKLEDNVYYKKADKNDTDAPVDVKIFSTIKISQSATNDTLNDLTSGITITAYAVQQEGISEVADAWNAVKDLSASETTATESQS